MRTHVIFMTGILALVYFIAGKLGLTLAFVNASATAVWPPTGIAVAAFLLFGYQVWPAIFLGAFLVNLTTDGSFVTSLGIALGNTFEGLIAAYAIGVFARGRRAFDRPADVFKFALIALTSTMVSATIGVTTLVLTTAATWSDIGAVWLTWWLGDTGGALIVAPLVVLWATRSPEVWTARRVLEGLLLLLALFVVGLAVFGGLTSMSTSHYPIEFLTVPVLIWAAFRFGPRDAATSILFLTVMAIWGTLRGLGPFIVESENQSLLVLQAFLGVMTVMTLVLAAAVLDQRRAEERIRAAERRLRQLEEQSRQREVRRADEAEASRDQLREFMGMVVHDLRSPLTAALGNTQLSQRQLTGADYPKAQQTLGRVEISLRTMRRLVNDLLDSVRIGSGRFVIDRGPVDLADLAAKTIEELPEVATAHHLVVDAPVPVLGEWDADRLRQILTNLVSNAIKYSPAGTEVRVAVVQSGENALLSVTDQGVGIAPDHLDQLFQPFARLDQERQATGTGLGLFITKGIVEAHGGQIRVESTLGRGSTFIVELPRIPKT